MLSIHFAAAQHTLYIPAINNFIPTDTKNAHCSIAVNPRATSLGCCARHKVLERKTNAYPPAGASSELGVSIVLNTKLGD